MATDSINRLMDQARMHLPGALDGFIKTELFSVLDTFFKDTNLWFEDLTFTANPTSNTYLQAPADYTYTLTPTSGQIVRLLTAWDGNEKKIGAAMPQPGQIIIQYPPATSSTFGARVALTVVDPLDADGYPVFPEWVLQRHGDVVLDGLLGYMMAQHAKPYSNPQLASVRLRKFRSGVSVARNSAKQQNVYGGQTWRFPQTFNRFSGP